MQLSTDKFRYFLDVESGETVCFQITPVGTAGTFATSGAECVEDDGDHRCCFDMGEQDFRAVFFQFDFASSDDDSARFDVTLKGSRCGEIQAPSIRKTHQDWKRVYNFLRVEDSCG